MAATTARGQAKVVVATRGKGDWLDHIYDAIGKYVNLETSEGIQRNGRLSGVRSITMLMNGKKVDVPKELEINGDPTDTIDLWRLIRIDIT